MPTETKNKKALLFFDKFDSRYVEIEVELVKKGFQVLRVSSYEKFFERTKSEMCHVFVVFYSDRLHFENFAQLTKNHLPSRLTPKVFIGPSLSTNQDQYSSILNQMFPLEIEKELVAEFCDETYELFYKDSRRLKFENIQVPNVMASLSLLSFSGVMEVENSQERCSVYFAAGKIVCASSSRQDKRFGQLLLQYGLVTKDQVDRVSSILETQRKKVGQVFVDLGMISDKKLLEILELQVKHIVIPMFNWDQGTLEIFFDCDVKDSDFPIRMEVYKIVLEGIKLRLSEQELSKALVGQRGFVVYVGGKFPFSQKEHDLLSLVKNKPMEIEDVLSYEKFAKIELLRSLYLLWIFGVLDFKELKPSLIEPRKNRKEEVQSLFADTNPSSYQRDLVNKKKVRAPYLLLLLFVSAVAAYVVHRKGKESSTPAPVAQVQKTVQPTPIPPTETPVETPEVAPTKEIVTQIPVPQPKAQPVQSPSVKEDRGGDLALIKRLLNEGKYDAAKKLISDILPGHPSYGPAMILLGEVYMQEDNYKEAEKVFLSIVRYFPSNAQAHLNLGTIYIHLQNNEKARNHLEMFLKFGKGARGNQAKIREVQKVLQSMEASR